MKYISAKRAVDNKDTNNTLSVQSNEDVTFEEALKLHPKMHSKVEKLKGDNEKNILYNMAKNEPFSKIRKMYFSKESLVDDKKLSSEEIKRKSRKRDTLISQLFKIQKLILLYDNKKYNELIREIDYHISSIEDKRCVNEKFNKLKEAKNSTIEEIIDLADKLEICKKDDKFDFFLAITNIYMKE